MKPTVNLYGDEWSAEIYDYEVQSLEDLPLYQSLAESAGGPALELACGTGRLVLPLARAGFSVTGLDASPFMLAVARPKLAQEDEDLRARCRLVEGNMSGFTFEEGFGLIYIPARSFQALLTRDEQRSCLECCARHLKHQGRLAVNVFNPMLSKLVAHRVEEGPDEFSAPDGTTVRWSAVTEYDLAAHRLSSAWRYEHGNAGAAATTTEYLLEIRYFYRFEMEWVLEACGFEVEALYGNLDRSPFAADSPEMIFVARKGEA